MKKSIEKYFNRVAINEVRNLKKRISESIASYQKQDCNKYFFLNIEIRNLKRDLVWYRDEVLKTHLFLCNHHELDRDCFAVEHVEYHIKKLVNIEEKNFIQIFRIVDPWWGYSEKAKNDMNKHIIDIIKKMK